MDDDDELAKQRARVTLGTSSQAAYRMVASELKRRGVDGVLYDVGCGAGMFYSIAATLPMIKAYVGVDIVRYDSYPAAALFCPAPLDQIPWPIEDGVSDLTCCIETIEHLENPRAVFRELKRITRPGGLVIVTTPNQTSLLSKLTLVIKNQFNAFQDGPGLYPSHMTALLPIDLQRIATECELTDPVIRFSDSGRILGSAAGWPTQFGFRGRSFSDTVMLSARR